jgi:hypothetical protein
VTVVVAAIALIAAEADRGSLVSQLRGATSPAYWTGKQYHQYPLAGVRNVHGHDSAVGVLYGPRRCDPGDQGIMDDDCHVALTLYTQPIRAWNLGVNGKCWSRVDGAIVLGCSNYEYFVVLDNVGVAVTGYGSTGFSPQSVVPLLRPIDADEPVHHHRTACVAASPSQRHYLPTGLRC